MTTSSKMKLLKTVIFNVFLIFMLSTNVFGGTEESKTRDDTNTSRIVIDKRQNSVINSLDDTQPDNQRNQVKVDKPIVDDNKTSVIRR